MLILSMTKEELRFTLQLKKVEKMIKMGEIWENGKKLMPFEIFDFCSGKEDIVETLIKNGTSDVDIVDDKGRTGMCIAIAGLKFVAWPILEFF